MALRVAVLVAVFAAAAALRMPTAIDSNMVLGRAPFAARIWGFGNASEVVSVTLDSSTVKATTGSDGLWLVELPPQEARTGCTLTISSSTGQRVVLTNIDFGDVYLCSGQSNMEFSVNTAFNASAEIADSINYPHLRFFTVGKVPATTPQSDCTTKTNYTWGVSGPSTITPVNGTVFTWFSAACYFFGRDLYKSLDGKVPIGLVASDWGSQRVEAFSSPDAINDKTCGGTVKPTTSVLAGPPPAPNPADTTLWYGMICPLLNMRFSGATWYQGESNVDDPTSYACHFPAMIADWRKKMNLTLPFYFVELAAYTTENFALIREAQLAALKLPNVGFATAIDIGDPTSPIGSIHPRRKQEVGRRLSLNAQYSIYHQKVEYLGPTLDKWSLKQDKSSGLWYGTVAFTSADVSWGKVEGNVHSAGTAACTLCCTQSPFQIGDGSAYVRANFTIQGAAVELVANFSGVATQILYAFEAYPECSLYNGQGGPDNHTGLAAPPFRTPAPPPKNYTLLFRQTWPAVFTPQEWSLNEDDATQEMFSRLDKMEQFRDQAGRLNFKLVWPMAHGAQRWKQTSNPVNTIGKVEGYQPISVSSTSDGWAGLAADRNNALLDGSWASGYEGQYWYALGTFKAFSDTQGHTGIPAYADYAAGAVELYVRNVNGGWTLMLRQPAGFYFAPGQLSVNEHNPHSSVYAALTTMEQYRARDGTFEFLLLWPDTFNTWSQSSNPVNTSPGGVTGYLPETIQCGDNYFGGLEHNTGGQSLLDGSVGSDEWYYAIGDFGTSPWGNDGIPACNSNAPQMMTELSISAPN